MTNLKAFPTTPTPTTSTTTKALLKKTMGTDHKQNISHQFLSSFSPQ